MDLPILSFLAILRRCKIAFNRRRGCWRQNNLPSRQESLYLFHNTDLSSEIWCNTRVPDWTITITWAQEGVLRIWFNFWGKNQTNNAEIPSKNWHEIKCLCSFSHCIRPAIKEFIISRRYSHCYNLETSENNFNNKIMNATSVRPLSRERKWNFRDTLISRISRYKKYREIIVSRI